MNNKADLESRRENILKQLAKVNAEIETLAPTRKTFVDWSKIEEYMEQWISEMQERLAVIDEEGGYEMEDTEHYLVELVIETLYNPDEFYELLNKVAN